MAELSDHGWLKEVGWGWKEPFPPQGMLVMVVDLRSIRLTQAGAGDGDLNPALPSQQWDASVRGKKPLLGHWELWGSKTWGKGCRAGSGHGPVWSPGCERPQVLTVTCGSPSFMCAPSTGPSTVAASTRSHLLLGMEHWAPAVGLMRCRHPSTRDHRHHIPAPTITEHPS